MSTLRPAAAPKPASRSTAAMAAGLFGGVFAFMFLTLNDPDAMPPHVLGLSKWLVVLPAALLFAMRPSSKAWATGLAMAGGIFAGTCVLAAARGSNIWPIAGVYWTIVWALPIALGSAGGAFVAYLLRKPATQ